jgi:hypothetical protein
MEYVVALEVAAAEQQLPGAAITGCHGLSHRVGTDHRLGVCFEFLAEVLTSVVGAPGSTTAISYTSTFGAVFFCSPQSES